MPDDQAATRSDTSCLDAALDLARYGFSVFPLIPNEKRPLIENWRNLATNDSQQIRQWWQAQPNANVGISTENLLVVDVDPRNGGVETFKKLVENGGLLGEEFPPTLAAGTQGGGTHMLYWLPEHTTVRGGANKLGPGVDVKSHGGYIVAAGSTIDGRNYFWKKTYEPDKRAFTEAPQWLIERCNAAKPKSSEAGKIVAPEDEAAIARAEHYLQHNAPEAIQGGRDNTAYAVAARLYDFGVSKDTCRELLETWNEGHCHPPLEPHEIERIAWSASVNRENAIGAKHPDAPGFDTHEVAPKPADPLDPAPAATAARKGVYWLDYNTAATEALTQVGQPLIEGLLDREAMSVWYGESNSGKTFVLLDAAWHIAAGRQWAGMPVHGGAVAYVAAEGGRGVLKRVRALKERYPEAGEVPLCLIPCPVDLLRPDADLRALAAAIKDIEASKGKVGLIVIDTLSRAMAGGNENSPDDMGAFVKHLDALRRAIGAHIAVVHHTGKDKAKGARGHSLLRAATDTEVEIGDRTLTVTKQRDMDGDLTLGFTLKPARLGAVGGREITSCTVDLGKPGETGIEPVALQPRLANLFEAIEAKLDEQDPIEGASGKTFGWEFAAQCLTEFHFRQTSDKPVRRTTVLTMLSELSEKGWIKKVDKNQWVIVVVGNVGNVEN